MSKTNNPKEILLNYINWKAALMKDIGNHLQQNNNIVFDDIFTIVKDHFEKDYFIKGFDLYVIGEYLKPIIQIDVEHSVDAVLMNISSGMDKVLAAIFLDSLLVKEE